MNGIRDLNRLDMIRSIESSSESIENDFCFKIILNLYQESIMNVASISNFSASFPSSEVTDNSVNQKYMAFIKEFYNIQAYINRDVVNSEDGELAKFKSDLVTKGAVVFLKELDEEKIKALVEEYREKLLKEKEKNPEIPMDINKMVSNFKKQLIEEMIEAQKAEEEKQKQDQKAKLSESNPLTTADIFDNIQDADLKSSNKETVNLLELMMNAVCIKHDIKEMDS
jgi:hypothetical protein